MHTLQANVNHLLAWYAAFPKPPCTLWQQTLPQHFPTETGTYAAVGYPLTNASLKNECLPLHLPVWTEQKFNDAADALINQTNIPIIKLWREFAPNWDLHNDELTPQGNLDCTHWRDSPGDSPVLVRAAHAVVSSVKNECKWGSGTSKISSLELDSQLSQHTSSPRGSSTSRSTGPALSGTFVDDLRRNAEPIRYVPSLLRASDGR
jgi:hypothetical protein